MAVNTGTNTFEHDVDSVEINQVASSAGSSFVFWMLLAMGMSTLAACVLVPAWGEYAEQATSEQRADYQVAKLQHAVDQEKRLLEALRSDPAAIARLAKRELAYREPNEQVLSVDTAKPGPFPVDLADGFVPQPVDPPAVVANMIHWLPNYDYQTVFCDPQTRLTLIVMSVALICLAFVLNAKSISLHD